MARDFKHVVQRAGKIRRQEGESDGSQGQALIVEDSMDARPRGR